jgi:hypothetical protein
MILLKSSTVASGPIPPKMPIILPRALVFSPILNSNSEIGTTVFAELAVDTILRLIDFDNVVSLLVRFLGQSKDFLWAAGNAEATALTNLLVDMYLCYAHRTSHP